MPNPKQSAAHKNAAQIYLGGISRYATFDEVRDIEMADALNSLLSILASGLKDGDIQIGERTRKELLQWYISQPQFIRSICEQSMMEASLLYEEDEMSRSA